MIPCLLMAQQSQLTDAGKVFRENEILLTGGNGFLGKVILAMLLERYPHLKHLHVLLRPGRGLSAEERFQAEIMDSPVMAALIGTRGESFIRERVSIWAGELSRPDCGLDQQALETIAARVKLIINCAGKWSFSPRSMSLSTPMWTAWRTPSRWQSGRTPGCCMFPPALFPAKPTA